MKAEFLSNLTHHWEIWVRALLDGSGQKGVRPRQVLLKLGLKSNDRDGDEPKKRREENRMVLSPSTTVALATCVYRSSTSRQTDGDKF